MGTFLVLVGLIGICWGLVGLIRSFFKKGNKKRNFIIIGTAFILMSAKNKKKKNRNLRLSAKNKKKKNRKLKLSVKHKKNVKNKLKMKQQQHYHKLKLIQLEKTITQQLL